MGQSIDPRRVSRERIGRMDSVLQEMRDLEHNALLHPEREYEVTTRLRALRSELRELESRV